MKKILLKTIEKLLIALFATVSAILFTVLLFIVSIFNFIATLPI